MAFNYQNVKYINLGAEGQFLVYIPDYIDENTRTFVYSHGAGGSWNPNENGFSNLGNYLERNGSDSIVVVPTSWAGYTDPRWADKTMNMVENVWDEYGILNRNVDTAGWSGGGQNAFYITIENIKRNPELEPQMIFLLDDYCEDSVTNVIHNPNESILVNGGREALIQNNTIIFSLMSTSENTSFVNNKNAATDILVQEGLNIIKVKCDDGSHVNINNNFFKNGWIDYTNGKVGLPSEGYSFYTYKTEKNEETGEETGSWVSIDVSEIDTIEELYDLFEIDYEKNEFMSLTYAEKIDRLMLIEDISIKGLAGESYYVRSDAELLQDKLNDIVGKIRNSTVVQEMPDFLNYIGSTTNVPKQIPSVVQGFFGISANLMFSLNNDCREFAKVGLSLTEIDNRLKDDTDKL